MNTRDQLSEIAQRRYDIELRRMRGKHGMETGLRKTEHMAKKWLASEKKLRPLNEAKIERVWRRKKRDKIQSPK